MVSLLSIIAMFVTLIICMVVPVLAVIIYSVKNKRKGVWLAWFIGAAGFFVMQIIIRTPILSVLSLNEGFVEFANKHYIAYVAILAFTAALFELIARVAGASILKKKRSYEVAFGAGLGHGGIEAIVIVGMTYINNLLYSAMINTGAFDTMVESTAQMGVDENTLKALWEVKTALIETSAGSFLLAGYERILTMILHVAMTVLVFYFVNKKKSFLGILLCLLIHTAIDFVPGFVQGFIYGADVYGKWGDKISVETAYVIIYGFLTVMAVVGIIIMVSIKKKWKKA